MSAIPPHREAFAAADPVLRAGARWAVLEGAARTVAGLAGRPDEVVSLDFGGSQSTLRPAAAELSCRAIDDLAAVLEPGIAALLAVRERGQDPSPAAAALWDEFRLARAALLALVRAP